MEEEGKVGMGMGMEMEGGTGGGVDKWHDGGRRRAETKAKSVVKIPRRFLPNTPTPPAVFQKSPISLPFLV